MSALPPTAISSQGPTRAGPACGVDEQEEPVVGRTGTQGPSERRVPVISGHLLAVRAEPEDLSFGEEPPFAQDGVAETEPAQRGHELGQVGEGVDGRPVDPAVGRGACAQPAPAAC
jgi:hypothetical protein